MINKEFHDKYILTFDNIDYEEYLFNIFTTIKDILNKRIVNSKRKTYQDDLLIEYLFQEFLFIKQDYQKDYLTIIMKEKFFIEHLISSVSDKFFFNEMNQYQAISLLSPQSPIISTMDLFINFILNRITAIKKINGENDILIDMMSKVFLMFRSVNYLLSTGSETEAFATWRTIHELECVIKIIYNHPYLVPVYLQHIVYNNALRNDFDDKEVQEAVFNNLKENMKKHNLKSKDMKKYIEYGWLYSIENIEKEYPEFKLNFRNGLELVASLSSYAQDYEMSSEVAHSSPLLIYSNKEFFKSISIVRSYESFLRLEEMFFAKLKTYDIEISAYEKMRNLYIELCNKILNKEISSLQRLINKTLDNK